MTTPTDLAAELEREVAATGTPERAERERAYLKSDLRFLGASVPAVRAATMRLSRQHPGLGHDDVVALAVALIERFLRESTTWALVDGIAANVVGGLQERFPDQVEPTLEAWSRDADFWLRRASLLTYLVALRAGRGAFEQFAAKADVMLEEREFFVRKAIGWVLRDTGRRRPDLVVGWLEPRVGRASGVTLREAVKHLPDADRHRILDAAGR